MARAERRATTPFAPPPAGSERFETVAPAKINLYLHVVGRRDDGYHRLDSLIAFAGTGDRITVAAADDGLSLASRGPFAAAVPTGADNLALRAATALKTLAGHPGGASITLDKALPVAAGIGGGSADAAAVLRALVRLWRLDLDPEALARLALSLGADVPACLRGGAASVAGIGEWITPAPSLPPAHLLLVNPAEPLSTQAVFAARSGSFSAPAPITEAMPDATALAQALARRRNDLEAAAISLCPAVGAVLAAIAAAEGCLLARMSGSGATGFGLFAAADEAADAGRRIGARHPGWWVATAPLLNDIVTARSTV